VRPFGLVGLGLYGAHERTAVEYSDYQGQGPADAGPAHSTSTFLGLGGNVGHGLEWDPAGRRLGWTVAVRRHDVIGGGDTEFRDSGTYTATLGLTLL
jgi:hypothetical protein